MAKIEIMEDNFFDRYWSIISILCEGAEEDMYEALEADISDRGSCSIRIGLVKPEELKVIIDVMSMHLCRYWLDEEPAVNPSGDYSLWVESRMPDGRTGGFTWGLRRENPKINSRGNRRKSANSRKMPRGGIEHDNT